MFLFYLFSSHLFPELDGFLGHEGILPEYLLHLSNLLTYCVRFLPRHNLLIYMCAFPPKTSRCVIGPSNWSALPEEPKILGLGLRTLKCSRYILFCLRPRKRGGAK